MRFVSQELNNRPVPKCPQLAAKHPRSGYNDYFHRLTLHRRAIRASNSAMEIRFTFPAR